MADSLNIHRADQLHHSISNMTGFGQRDDIVYAVTDASIAALEYAIAVPASGLDDLKAKLDLLLRDAADCGVVEVEYLTFLRTDIEGLIGGVQ